MKTKIYITTETFPALTAFLQKGLEQKMRFFIYDENDLIKNRLWTFSSAVFLPNVINNDAILQKHQVPVVISTDADAVMLDNYSRIIYECSSACEGIHSGGAIFSQNKEDAINTMAMNSLQSTDCNIFIKNENKWNKVTSLQP